MNTSKGCFRVLTRLMLPQACCLLIAAAPALRAQTAQAPAEAPPTSQAAPPPTVSAPAPAPAPDQTLVLSPFEVQENTTGYYTPNTESATRINSKLQDIGSAISVVSKQEMSDFAMLNINDIFMYSPNAQGANTYTANTIDRNGSVADSNQLNNTQANQIRGMGPANQYRDDFEMMGRSQMDPINIDSVEISRGPNASVFGIGNPSGTVNVISAKANLSKDFTTVQFRGDSYGGYRTSLDLNRILIPDKLAVRVGLVGMYTGFERKPSGLDDTRYDGMLTYKPFKWTTLHVEFEDWKETGNRPNDTMPRDYVSYWLSQGRPTWDPVTQTITLNGQLVENTSTTPATTTFPTATGLPSYFENTFTGSTRSQVFIDQNGNVGYWSPPTTYSNTLGPISGTQNDRYMGTSPDANTNLGLYTNQPLFSSTPSVGSKQIYNYAKLNYAAINRDADEDKMYEATLDQVLVDTPMNNLTAQVGFFEEDEHRYQRNLDSTLNSNGQSGQLFIDVNQRNLDGTPNKFFLEPYIGSDQPITLFQPARWQAYRGQLAYKLDFTNNRNWTRWLGTHEIALYNEYRYQINRQYAFKDALSSPEPWIPAGLSRGNQGAISGGPAAALGNTRGFFRYYVGNNSGNAEMTTAPVNFSYGIYPYVWGNSATGVFNYAPASLSQVAVTDSTGGGSNLKTIFKTTGAILQSHWLDDDLVTTIGEREDKQYQKSGATPQLLNPDGISFDYPSINGWAKGDYNYSSGKTNQVGAVGRPFKDIPFIAREAQQDTGLFRYIAQAFQGTEFFFNKSDSFLPQNFATNDFLQDLPNTTGTDLEYGMSMTLLDGKVVFRANRYESETINARNGNASTIAQRVLRIDVASTADFLLFTQAEDWVPVIHPTYTQDQVNAEVGNEMGIPYNTILTLQQAFNAGTIASTNNLTSNGEEYELDYNPFPWWTLQASFTDGIVSQSNVSQDVYNWIAQRLPLWTTIVDPRSNTLWWTTNYGGSQTAMQNYTTFVANPFDIIQQEQGKAEPEYSQYNWSLLTNIYLKGITNNEILSHFNVGGAIRWQSAFSIGYYGAQQLPATITTLNANEPIYSPAMATASVFLGYRTMLFNGKVPTTVQLNVNNLGPGASYLQAIAAYPDGEPTAFRIFDPRQYILTVTFDL